MLITSETMAGCWTGYTSSFIPFGGCCHRSFSISCHYTPGTSGCRSEFWLHFFCVENLSAKQLVIITTHHFSPLENMTRSSVCVCVSHRMQFSCGECWLLHIVVATVAAAAASKSFCISGYFLSFSLSLCLYHYIYICYNDNKRCSGFPFILLVYQGISIDSDGTEKWMYLQSHCHPRSSAQRVCMGPGNDVLHRLNVCYTCSTLSMCTKCSIYRPPVPPTCAYCPEMKTENCNRKSISHSHTSHNILVEFCWCEIF